MNTRNKIRITASVLFGAIVAVLAVTDSPAMTTFAVVGGIALGVFYVLTGFVGQPGVARQRARR